MPESGRAPRRVAGVAAITAAALATALLIPGASANGGREWTNTEVPNPQKSTALYGVDAVAADEAWAVGNHYGGLAASVIMHWDGKRWNETEHPKGAYLGAVDAVSTDAVWAVGQGPNAPYDHGWVVHWDGRQWKRVVTPDPGSDTSDLYDVSALDAGTVWAGGLMTNESRDGAAKRPHDRDRKAGRQADGYTHAGFVQRWDGTEWTVHKPPVPDGADYVTVSNVHAVSVDEVWATGNSYVSVDEEQIPQPWAARYSDGEWTTVRIPDVDGKTEGFVTGIAPNGDGTLSLVGHTFSGAEPVPMILEWNGQEVSRKDFAGVDAFIDSAIADSRGGLLLTGGTGADGQHPTVLRYDGGDLAAHALPDTDEYAYLPGLAVVPDTAIAWTVGANTTAAGMPTGPIAAYTELG